jgi:hypothetical protein
LVASDPELINRIWWLEPGEEKRLKDAVLTHEL